MEIANRRASTLAFHVAFNLLENPPELHQEIQTFAQQGIKDKKGKRASKSSPFVWWCLAV